jgi:hypothetical protein
MTTREEREAHAEHVKRSDRVLTHAYRFPNNNVMAFDQFGQQMPEYQGDDAIEKIGRDFPDVRMQIGFWR